MNPASAEPLPRAFYTRDAVRVARALLGQRLVRYAHGKRVSGRIVETEAYLGARDLAAHTVGGRRTRRNASMWARGGTAYVYFTYGMHHCMNVVAGEAEEPVAVLLRALEPEEGLEAMAARRRAGRRPADYTSGPAKLCEALAIDRDLDGEELTGSGRLWIEKLRERAMPARWIGIGPRVGVGYAGAWAQTPLRFWIKGHPCVSPAKA